MHLFRYGHCINMYIILMCMLCVYYEVCVCSNRVESSVESSFIDKVKVSSVALSCSLRLGCV